MIVLADENIPEVHHFFARLGEVRTIEGRAIDRRLLDGVDVLLVRSVTRVDASLLKGSRVRFVGSATIGTDHIDVEGLREMGVAFAHAPGSNAESVVEYVTAAMLEAQVAAGNGLSGRTLGVVGYGDIGSRIARRAEALGMRVLVNDPPLEERGVQPSECDQFFSLQEVLSEADVVTLHVPLSKSGPWPTPGMISARELSLLPRGALLINTSRGPVVSGKDLLSRLRREDGFRAVLDVFEGEPRPDLELIERLFLATPHIAGYSYDGKLNGTRMLFEALCRFEQVGIDCFADESASEEPVRLHAPTEKDPVRWLRSLVRQMYDIRQDDRRLREMLSLPVGERESHFNRCRKEYPKRRTFGMFGIDASDVPDELRKAVEVGLQVRVW